MRNIFCSLCGVILDPVHRGQTPSEHLSWIQKIRAVQSTLGTSIPLVTGLGYLNDSLELVAPSDEELQFHNLVDELETYPLYKTPNRFRAFTFHDACWR
ncbi:hypothetical protein EJ08DRAFT_388385 [Tothia fuscella]|uniref:Uncharacterized protein n=1 Tax=Tothia fuscella TaxID=1048955 RepID=A0A9P4U3I4_9PEZI|nr:hypothetical protein EJ08DRAFT_388385 [Tothia fuscella]